MRTTKQIKYKVERNPVYEGAYDIKTNTRKHVATFYITSGEAKNDADYCARALNMRQLTREFDKAVKS